MAQMLQQRDESKCKSSYQKTSESANLTTKGRAKAQM